MALISLQNISISHNGPLLLDNINLNIDSSQRISLLGRNGSGKSTLMNIIAGQIKPDSGEIIREPNVKIAYCSQEIPVDIKGTVFEVIVKGLGPQGDLYLKYKKHEKNTHNQEVLHKLHDELDKCSGWSVPEEVNKITSKMSLDMEWEYNNLSGGQRKRVNIAAALAGCPDLLLLDEPTNHLDINTISWLEEYLLKEKMTVFFVTHDRAFLKNIATRIIELDRGELADWSCDYTTFLKRKQAALDSQGNDWKKFDKKLAQEEIWIRKGIKARRTRNEGRARALVKMREERKQRRYMEGSASLEVSSSGRSGKIVIEAKDISYSYDDSRLINDFSILIGRGDKIGITGPNGCGKTTLINLLLKNTKLQTGTVKLGTNLSVIYYDQLREKLDEDKTVIENILSDSEYIKINGRDKHIISYLQDFLFTPERVKTKVRFLSGGERNRLLLARLFTKSANFLIFDEPTNDLDAETLELLEELLMNFAGTVLLICHDRAFLNNVVQSTLVFTGKGEIKEIIGGYDEWLRQTRNESNIQPGKSNTKTNVVKTKAEIYREEKKAKRIRKLSFNENRELKALPGLIESMEEEQSLLHEDMADPDFYREKDKVKKAKERLEELEIKLSEAYERWDFLEKIEKN